MTFSITPVENSAQKRRFINLEWEINRDTPQWISPLRVERKEILNTKKNPFYRHARQQLFLAYRNGIPMGRIAAIINENHNAFHNEKSGFWGFFECRDDQEAASGLFETAADWIRKNGMENMYGPMNPSTNDEVGLLVEGFDTPPYIMMPHNPEYYPALVEGAGNSKAMDLFAWHITAEAADKGITEKMLRVSDKIMKKYNITLRNLELKKLDTEIKIIQDIYNDAWSDNWGFVPLTDEEIDYIGGKLKQFAREELLLMAFKDGKPIGFSITLPNLNQILARIPSGRLLPTGIFKLLAGMRKIDSARVLILGVKKEFQFIGLGSIFYIETIKRAIELGINRGEMSWILENNFTMNRAIEAIGSKCYKRYRIYSYPLE